MRLTNAFNRTLLALLPVLALAAGCTKINPDFCDRPGPCGPGRTCHMRTNTCLAVDAGSEDDVDAAPDLRPALPDIGVDRAPDLRAPDAQDSCASDDDCPAPDKPMCLAGICRKCQGAADCGPATPACGPAGRCVECADDKDCLAPGKPICDTQASRCVACTTDAQCAKKLGLDPGVCMAHEDGRCATAAETVFARAAAGCSMVVTAGGSPGTPYCLAQDAITAAAAGGKPLVVMRGPMDRWAYTGSGKVTVVGQNGAKVVGAGVGVRISGGDVYLRGLTISVSGATGTGLVAENGAVLRMNRCLVENNGAGGISVNNAGFDIVNTIIAGNDPGETTPGSGITFGGVYLNGGAGQPQRFAYDTVVGNKAIGVYCADAYAVKAVLANANLVSDLHLCAPTASSLVDPKFDPLRPYHLMATSPCVNAGDPMDFPPDDYDGDARPQMSISDCGADEYK